MAAGAGGAGFDRSPLDPRMVSPLAGWPRPLLSIHSFLPVAWGLCSTGHTVKT